MPDRFIVQTFLQKVTTRNEDSSTSLVKTVPCDAGTEMDICTVEVNMHLVLRARNGLTRARKQFGVLGRMTNRSRVFTFVDLDRHVQCCNRYPPLSCNGTIIRRDTVRCIWSSTSLATPLFRQMTPISRGGTLGAPAIVRQKWATMGQGEGSQIAVITPSGAGVVSMACRPGDCCCVTSRPPLRMAVARRVYILRGFTS